MKRLIEKDLLKWKKSSNRKPLIIFGARQIGKTYSILDFGKKEYINVAYCNFENNTALSDIFNIDLDPERIVKSLSSFLGINILKEKTLIVFDEIQACEKALTSLKYFNEQANDYHIISAGSLLGLAINRGHYSFPVGKVNMLNMYPLSFEEFLLATNNESLRNLIIDSYNNMTPFSLHEKALELYRLYLVVGGYPAVVKKYLETKDFNYVRAEQSFISDAYISDMAKYATPSEIIRSIDIYKSIVAQLSKNNSKFQYSVINSTARAKDYELSLYWLIHSNTVLKCTKVNEGFNPITIYENNNSYKIYYSDIGLFSSRLNLNHNLILNNINISDKARGILAESYVAQELASKNIKLHYWDSNNTAEVDFVIDLNDDGGIPIEVKSSDNVRSKSLQIFINKYSPSYSIRVSTKNFGFENNIKSIPLYALFCL